MRRDRRGRFVRGRLVRGRAVNAPVRYGDKYVYHKSGYGARVIRHDSRTGTVEVRVLTGRRKGQTLVAVPVREFAPWPVGSVWDNPRRRRRRQNAPAKARVSTARFRSLIRYASGFRDRSWGDFAAKYADWLTGKGPLPHRPATMTSENAEIIMASVARIYGVRDHAGNRPRAHAANPPGRELIYPSGRMVGTWYGRHRTGGYYKHKFTHADVSLYGFPDGSILLKPKRGRLWRQYPFER